jgi:hypothetical protein
MPEEPVETNARVNLQKFYNMYCLAAELETFRLSTFEGKLTCTRENNGLLENHIRSCANVDNAIIGLGTVYSTGSNPSNNDVLNSADGFKALRNIIKLMVAAPPGSLH